MSFSKPITTRTATWGWGRFRNLDHATMVKGSFTQHIDGTKPIPSQLRKEYDQHVDRITLFVEQNVETEKITSSIWGFVEKRPVFIGLLINVTCNVGYTKRVTGAPQIARTCPPRILTVSHTPLYVRCRPNWRRGGFRCGSGAVTADHLPSLVWNLT